MINLRRTKKKNNLIKDRKKGGGERWDIKYYY